MLHRFHVPRLQDAWNWNLEINDSYGCVRHWVQWKAFRERPRCFKLRASLSLHAFLPKQVTQIQDFLYVTELVRWPWCHCAHLCTMQGEAEFLNAQGELAKLRLQLDWSRDRDETKIERGRNRVLRNLGHMKSKENKLSRIGKEVHGTAVESQNQR